MTEDQAKAELVAEQRMRVAYAEESLTEARTPREVARAQRHWSRQLDELQARREGRFDPLTLALRILH